MGRNKKIGLDYFPFDVDFFDDIKVRKLIKYQGGKAVSVYALLLCTIYKCGYYVGWDEELPFIISERTGFEEAYVSEVIKSCLSIGLFNKELFDKDRILTSKGIQERYEQICVISRRVGITSEYTLISSEEKPIKSEETSINSEKSAQRKVKKRKENINPPISPDGGGAIDDSFPFDTIWELYDKKIGDRERLRRKWEKLSIADKQAIFAYVPRYKSAQPTKQYRKNFDTFLNNKSWNDEIITEQSNDKPYPHTADTKRIGSAEKRTSTI